MMTLARKQGRLAWIVSLLFLALLVGTGCDQVADDGSDGNGYTAPPEQMLGTWHLYAGQADGQTVMVDLEYLNISIEIYADDNLDYKFTMDIDGDRSSGDVDWRERDRHEYLTLIENGSDETEIEVLVRSEHMAQLWVPGGGDPDQLWVMAKGGFKVVGLVVDDATNEPIAAANVVVTNQSDEEVTSTMTADMGVFLATDLDVEALHVEVSKDGYQTVGDWVAIDYANPTFISFRMQQGTTTQDATVHGFVYDDANDAPIEGATVATTDGSAETTADASGAYSMTLPAGDYVLAVSADGYSSYTTDPITLTSGMDRVITFYLVAGGGGSGTVHGVVTGSQDGEAIEGATVSVDGESISTTTDVDGNYTLTVPEGNQTLSVTMDGYYSNEANIFVEPDGDHEKNFVLSPILSGGSGAMRLVLTWGEEPSDLDSHLKTPAIDGTEYHVYFGDHGDSTSAPYAHLDLDDVSSYGPETITIYQFESGTYRYYIYNWSGSPAIAGSEAQVQMYDESGLLQTVVVPSTGEGDYWYVCDIDGDSGAITLVNQIMNDAPELTAGNDALKMR